jgi:ATP-dependent exoDNAse (exonuclease V) beta subunit
MSSPVLLHSLDDAARERALDPRKSFTVRAPAGSGKTELLIQRFLGLLAVVDRPESIVAITFTRKAAGEMMQRITGALRDAQAGTAIEKPHHQIARDLALRALARDRELGWNLLEHPGRLRVQTIDSLCMSIVGEMPWLSRMGGMPGIQDDAEELYAQAARLTLAHEGLDYQDSLTTLLAHLDNNATQARQLIATMLARRDQWLKFLYMDAAGERAAMEATLARAATDTLIRADDLIPGDLRDRWLASAQFAAAYLNTEPIPAWPVPSPEQWSQWVALTKPFLTADHTWRKKLDKRCGFPTTHPQEKQAAADLIAALEPCHGLPEALAAVRDLPPVRFEDAHWNVLRALLETLNLAVGLLKVTFQEERRIDFIELGLAAHAALGDRDTPSELAFRLDSRIEHLLVDEFQDTSRIQFELLEKLTAEWQTGDGRTLFLVGDPMQSIYRFRQAEVGLFLWVEQHGMGNLRPEPIELRLNRRSLRGVVERVKELLQPAFPEFSDPETGAIPYTESIAAENEDGGEVTFDGFLENGPEKKDREEAECVLRRIEAARAKDPKGSVAILVRARSHLFAITKALRAAGMPFQAVEIEALEERTSVRDLLALTRALLSTADRVAWLAILRAPWCGLALGDLEALVRDRPTAWIEDCLMDLAGLSPDGQRRAARVRDVLAEALAESGRWPLRRWLERTWIRLGGPACLQGDEAALADAAAYLDLLEAEQSGTGLRDFDQFERRVAKLFAQPQNSASAKLQVMTIHKAKGLEFDTVIVPGLGRVPKIDDSPLILFHEQRVSEGYDVLLAPISESGADKTRLYRYLQALERRKSKFENTRQLYVAATRAKKRLHLLGQVKVDSHGDLRPSSQTMLPDIWGQLTPEERSNCLRPQATDAPEPDTAASKQLKRLPASWQMGELPAPVKWNGAGQLIEEPHEPTFEWVGESLRHAGTVVHAFLQRMSTEDAAAPELAVIRKAVAHAGVVPSEIDSAAQRAHQAILRVLGSSRGRWILASHDNAHSEYAVTGSADGEIVSGLIDRTFVENGVRWIIDFKTSTHQGGSLTAFLDEQQRRYQDQMNRYARILAPLGDPVRLGLYFPLLDEWREWAPETA